MENEKKKKYNEIFTAIRIPNRMRFKFLLDFQN